ncbi:MAG TPA: S41 family peptidase [Anaerolineales bacterium]|nr:S41 family peptidase [Anaerolineales bacterium]HNO94874.1 S41 family peptidase [Anaerolineales bacterium]
MSRKKNAMAYGFTALLVIQLACSSLSPIADEPVEVTVPLGPQVTETEQQTAVLESMLSQIDANYIYQKNSSVDLKALHTKYQAKIDKGLTSVEFNELMKQLEAEFPTGDIVYATREERIENDTAASLVGYGGIGAFVNFQAEDEPHVVILDIIPGSPAEKAGLKAHDSIYAVNGDPVLLEEGADVVQRIRGEAGTKVVLTVKTPGKSERDVEVTRAQITGTRGVIAEEIPNTDIGYIRFPTVGSATNASEVLDAMETFAKNSNLKGIVLDLRISGGNSNFPLEDMLTLFLNDLSIDVYSLDKTNSFPIEGQDISGSQTIPLAVLVGENTNGTVEIFAAAIQEKGRGIVIGSNSAGGIEALSSFALPNGGQILIASASFRVGENERLGIDGVIPEVRVEAQWDDIIASEDPVIQQAIQSFEVQE